MEQLANKIAVITGAASGIGLGITNALIAEGVHVAMLDVEEHALNEAVRGIGQTNVDVQRFAVDVTSRESMQRTADEIKAHFGKVHILCNNAGVAVAGAVQDLTYEDWDWCLGVNLNGVINGMQSFLPLMTQHKEGGHIINTSSILGHLAFASQAVYCASKYAVLGISEAARADLAPINIGVSTLCPGMIATNIVRSDRNRPSDLGKGGLYKDPEQTDVLDAQFKSDGLSADTVGTQVVHAIKQNKAYIFTHAGLVEGIEARFQRILTDFDGTEASGGHFNA
ncbi:MAG: SDR family NAD(P)-dependent oxidoreductase [Pseudomonadota bacterium]|jgi:NAD(P)-dependent dehydrogenase (short-subunit alcohol dehydrogenase family)|nr:SDR family NAD(P)-dependent oxidoreductase [Pseudomonadota bacterium]